MKVYVDNRIRTNLEISLSAVVNVEMWQSHRQDNANAYSHNVCTPTSRVCFLEVKHDLQTIPFLEL